MPKVRQSGLSDAAAAQEDLFGGPPPRSKLPPPPDPELAREVLTGLLKKLKAAENPPSGRGLSERLSLALYKQSLPEEEAERLGSGIMREMKRLGIDKDKPREPRYITQERYDELTVRS